VVRGWTVGIGGAAVFVAVRVQEVPAAAHRRAGGGLAS
jgi:hypothetical protein